jgi:prolyl oligopeptidase
MVICDHLGKNKKNIKLPKYSSLMSVTTNKKEKDFFYSLTSFTFPQIVYKYNSIKNISLVFRATDNPINPKDYVAKQHWTTSQDGTRIPVFLFHKKGLKLNGDNPLILEGYGGFGVSLGPGFMRSWIPWLERGGIIATAIIRGGGEFGEKWHLQGIQQNKEKSFEDFIAINKFLIKKNYTSIEKIGSIGASNGGLLVTATAIKHPRLFKAVCALVPLTDMVKFHKFGIGIRWINEYGDPRNKKDLKNILKWSPYHNTKSKIKYPDFLFITAQQDSRVPSLHARKMTAILQKNNMSNTFLITEKNVGHGPGKPLDKIIEEQSMVLSFLTEQLKLLV